MNTRVAFLSAVAVTSLLLAAADAVAATDDGTPVLSNAAVAGAGAWVVRADVSLVAMRDHWLGMPGPEVGLTVGRTFTSRLSAELTGSVREAQQQSFSALALARLVVVASGSGRHALTIAAGPFVEFAHPEHGTVPFAHGELAYLYRHPSGLTVLAGGGPNLALASSSYVEPPSSCESPGHNFCIDFGPSARKITTGDAVAHMRLAVGWQF